MMLKKLLNSLMAMTLKASTLKLLKLYLQNQEILMDQEEEVATEEVATTEAEATAAVVVTEAVVVTVEEMTAGRITILILNKLTPRNGGLSTTNCRLSIHASNNIQRLSDENGFANTFRKVRS